MECVKHQHQHQHQHHRQQQLAATNKQRRCRNGADGQYHRNNRPEHRSDVVDLRNTRGWRGPAGGSGATVVTPSLLLAPGGSIDLSGGGTITLGPSAPVTPSLNAFTTDVMPSAGMIQVNTGGTFNGGQFDLAPGVGSVTGSIVNQGGTVTLQGQAVGAAPRRTSTCRVITRSNPVRLLS